MYGSITILQAFKLNLDIIKKIGCKKIRDEFDRIGDTLRKTFE